MHAQGHQCWQYCALSTADILSQMMNRSSQAHAMLSQLLRTQQLASSFVLPGCARAMASRLHTVVHHALPSRCGTAKQGQDTTNLWHDGLNDGIECCQSV